MNHKHWVIRTHKKFHPDEALGIFLLRKFGEEKWKGISRAEVIFAEAGEEWLFPLERTNIITVGTGKQLFDEHISAPGKDRIAECAATLIAKALSIQEKSEIKRLLDYVKEHDLNGKHVPMDFADFVVSLHQSYDEDEALSKTERILEALYFHEEMTMTQQERKKTVDFIEDWLQDKDKGIAGQILRFAKGLRNGNRSDFDFTEILTKLEKTYGEKEAHSLAQELLQAKYKRQEIYFEAIKETRNPTITEIIPVKRKDGLFLIVCAETDNGEYNRAARRELKADVVIQKNSIGRVLIFTAWRSPIKNEMTNIAAMLRLEEMRVRNQLVTLSYRRLTYGGAIEEVPQWYFQIENTPAGGKMLNGSKTATEIEPTAIPFERIKEIVKTALILGDNFRWQVWVEKNIDSRILVS